MLIGELEANMQYTVQLEVSFPYYMEERSIIHSLGELSGVAIIHSTVALKCY